MALLTALIAGQAPLPVAAQRVIAASGLAGKTTLLDGVVCDAALATELLLRTQPARVAQALVSRHVDGAGLGLFLRKNERRIGVLTDVVVNFILTPQQQDVLMALPNSHQMIKEKMLVSGWSTVPTVLGALQGMSKVRQLAYLGSARCHPDLTNDEIWKVITTAPDSLLNFAPFPPQSAPGADGPMRAARSSYLRQDTLRAMNTSHQKLIYPLIQVLFRHPELRDRALQLGGTGSWVALCALAHLHLTRDQTDLLVKLMIQHWPDTDRAYSWPTASLDAICGKPGLSSEACSLLAQHVVHQHVVYGQTVGSSTWVGSQYQTYDPAAVLTLRDANHAPSKFDVLQTLASASEQIRLGNTDPCWEEQGYAAVALLLPRTGATAQLAATLVPFVGYDWWLSLSDENKQGYFQRSAFKTEMHRRSKRIVAWHVARTGEAVRNILSPSAQRNRREATLFAAPRPSDADIGRTWTLPDASRGWHNGEVWQEHARFVATWLGEQFGEDAVRWECAMGLAEEFTGTFQELADTVHLLQDQSVTAA